METGKRFYEMSPHTYMGHEVNSMAKYMMDTLPAPIIALVEVYEGDMDKLAAWFAGMAFALAMIDDNGYPIDLDEVLHGWNEDYEYDLGAAIRGWLENH